MCVSFEKAPVTHEVHRGSEFREKTPKKGCIAKPRLRVATDAHYERIGWTERRIRCRAQCAPSFDVRPGGLAKDLVVKNCHAAASSRGYKSGRRS